MQNIGNNLKNEELKIKEEKQELIQMKNEFKQYMEKMQFQLDQQKMEQSKLQELSRIQTINNDNNLISERSKKLESENQSLKNQIMQMKDAKNLIKEKFEELNKKSSLIESNLQILNQRELEINSRENEILSLVNNYKYLLNSRFFQLNVSSIDNNSSYKYHFDELTNIKSLKLVSYSLPMPRLNINGNNNKLKIVRQSNDGQNKIEEIIIKKGRYTIERLIEVLNNKLEPFDLSIQLDETQYVRLTYKLSKSEQEKQYQSISLEKTNLSNYVLGFGDEDIKFNSMNYDEENLTDSYEESITAENNWDLRLNDRILLYIKNINDEPIAVLYFNGNSESTVNFENLIDLDHFDIELRDINGSLYDFNNLGHSINIQIEITNQMFDTTPETNNIFDIENENILNQISKINIDV